MTMIRTISGILAIQGIFWAFVTLWMFLMSISAAVTMLGGNFSAGHGYWLLIGLQIVFGWFIFIGWWVRTLDAKHLVPRRVFWILSALHHGIWAAVVVKYPITPDVLNTLVFSYLLVVILVSTIFAFLDRDPKPESLLENVEEPALGR